MEYSSYITQEDILAKNIRCKKSSKSIIVQNKLVIYGHNNQEISGANLKFDHVSMISLIQKNYCETSEEVTLIIFVI